MKWHEFIESLKSCQLITEINEDYLVFKVQRLLTMTDNGEIKFIPNWKDAEPYWSEVCMKFNNLDFTRMPAELERRLMTTD